MHLSQAGKTMSNLPFESSFRILFELSGWHQNKTQEVQNLNSDLHMLKSYCCRKDTTFLIFSV